MVGNTGKAGSLRSERLVGPAGSRPRVCLRALRASRGVRRVAGGAPEAALAAQGGGGGSLQRVEARTDEYSRLGLRGGHKRIEMMCQDICQGQWQDRTGWEPYNCLPHRTKFTNGPFESWVSGARACEPRSASATRATCPCAEGFELLLARAVGTSNSPVTTPLPVSIS